jgi:pimeloyl-ACP methyl ester carboxylesterase
MSDPRLSITAVVLLAILVFFVIAGCSSIERELLFYPTHRPHNNSLTPWMRNGEIIGYSRKIESPRNIWLMLHGNAGQASDRLYALPSFSPEDSVFILEYPGYGNRQGVPSKAAFNRAAKEAYLLLRETYPQIPICVAGESIGTGPAASLASLSQPPDKLVLIVPFDVLSLVAKEHFPPFLVNMILKSNWDNVEMLSHYKGAVEIYGAEADTIIPVEHAKALAAAIPGSKLVIVDGGHNDWSHQGRLTIRNLR